MTGHVMYAPIAFEDTLIGLSSEEFRRIIELARWAPSGDNGQPWRIRVSNDRQSLEVLCDRSQPQAFLDVNWDASRIAIGAFAENIKLAASAFQVSCGIDFASAPDEPVWARLRFALDRTAVPDPLANFLTKRVSNRRLYEPGSCSFNELDRLREATMDIPGVDVEFVTSQREIEKIAKAVGIADRVRMRHRQCHREFHEKVRWTDEEARENPTGFNVKTFEVQRHEAWVLRLTRNYGVMRVIDGLTRMSAIAARVAKRQVIASAAIGILSVNQQTPRQMMDVGRALQRIWLESTSRQIAFQVLAVAPLFIRRHILGGQGFSSSERRAVVRARSALASLNTNPPVENISIMFRLGRASQPSARTGRMSVRSLLMASSTSQALPETSDACRIESNSG